MRSRRHHTLGAWGVGLALGLIAFQAFLVIALGGTGGGGSESWMRMQLLVYVWGALLGATTAWLWVEPNRINLWSARILALGVIAWPGFWGWALVGLIGLNSDLFSKDGLLGVVFCLLALAALVWIVLTFAWARKEPVVDPSPEAGESVDAADEAEPLPAAPRIKIRERDRGV